VAARSTLFVAPTSLVADDTETATISAPIRDAQSNPVPGVAVTIGADGDGNTLSAEHVVSDASGSASASVKSSHAEVKTVTVSFGAGQILTAALTFLPGPPAAQQSSLTVTPETQVADGTGVALSAVFRDKLGNAVPGATVAFAVTGTDSTLSGETAATDASGAATVTLASTKAETKTVTAAMGEVTLTTTMTFVPGPPDAVYSTLTVDPQSLVADDASFATMAATIRDAQSNPVPGVEVAFTVTGNGHTLSSETGTTDADGATSATLKSSKAEAKTVTIAFGDGQVLNAGVTFIPGPPVGGQSSLTATPDTQVAGTPVALSATFRDALGNPNVGASVAFDATGEGSVLSSTTATTDASGVGSVTLSSTKSGPKSIAVTLGGLTLTTGVTFVPGPPSSAGSTLEASPASVVADNETTATLTAHVRDANGNPVAGVTVAISADGSGNTLSTTSGISDESGLVSATLKSGRAETKTVTFSFGTGQILTTTVTFHAGAPVAALSTLSADPDPVAADDIATTTLAAALQDALGNTVLGILVGFVALGTGNTLSANGATTD